MPHKVVAVAAGEAHTLALTADGSLFSWGRGTFGRLGTSREDDELFPVPIPSSDSPNASQADYVGIATGAYHSLGLRDDGSVWSWGYNVCQLGHDKEYCSIPCLVEHFKGLGSPDSLPDESSGASTQFSLKICTVKAGGMMSLAVDNHGSLWTWGNTPQATEDGQFCLSSSAVPLPVWHFHGHTVVKVACGNEHVIAVVSTGETYNGGDGDLVCYSWGNNKHGQLGLGDKESRSRPEIISTFDVESPWIVYEVACGAFHTAILANNKSYDQEIESKCWTCGLGENGQLGHGTTQSSSVPEPLDSLPRDAFLISLDCGLFHTSVVSSTGEVWSWGMEKGLGLCPDASFTGTDAGDAHLPLRIRAPEANGIRFTGPVQVACGAAHTVLVTDNGYKLYAWGRGRSGVLGTGSTTDSYAPSPVLWPPVAKKESNSRDTMPKTRDNEVGKLQETDQKLSAVTEELNLLRTKLTQTERYANLLHISIFRKPLDERRLSQSLQESGVFDVRKELEGALEKADDEELTRMEMFYRGMLSTVKDKLMKRRVKEVVKECLIELSTGRQRSSS